MGRTLYRLLAAALALALTGCGGQAQNQDHAAPSGLPEETEPAEQGENIAVLLTVGEQTFSATLADSDTAQELVSMLPLTLDMSELNGNEKYFYLDGSLTTNPQRPGQIHSGDLMLYGDNCLVLFYVTFSSGYSYTRLGSVDDPAGLAGALGTGNVTVTFALEE